MEQISQTRSKYPDWVLLARRSCVYVPINMCFYVLDQFFVFGVLEAL